MGASSSSACCSERALQEASNSEHAFSPTNAADEDIAKEDAKSTPLPGLVCSLPGVSGASGAGGCAVADYYYGTGALVALLDARDAVLIRGSWLADLASNGGTLPRRQALPSEAECGPRAPEHLPVVAVSYRWLSAEHPDPDGRQLRALGAALAQFIAWRRGAGHEAEAAVFLDWCSLFQEPRTAAEEAAFGRCLHRADLWYAHRETQVWALTAADGAGGAAGYGERGWPAFEQAAGQLATPPAWLLDLGRWDGHCDAWPRTAEVCRARRRPPLMPETFARELRRKAFSQVADQALLHARYAEAFQALMSRAECLHLGGLGWGDGEAHSLAEALPFCDVLLELSLRENRVCADGAARLAAAAVRCPRLQVLDLASNAVGDSGATGLAAALPGCRSLRSVDLSRNGIGDDGAAELAAALPLCGRLQGLLLGGNDISDGGAGHFAVALPDCAALRALDLSENDIGEAGARCLTSAAPRCTRLQRLDLARNRAGDAAVEHLPTGSSRVAPLGSGAADPF